MQCEELAEKLNELARRMPRITSSFMMQSPLLIDVNEVARPDNFNPIGLRESVPSEKPLNVYFSIDRGFYMSPLQFLCCLCDNGYISHKMDNEGKSRFVVEFGATRVPEVAEPQPAPSETFIDNSSTESMLPTWLRAGLWEDFKNAVTWHNFKPGGNIRMRVCTVRLGGKMLTINGYWRNVPDIENGFQDENDVCFRSIAEAEYAFNRWLTRKERCED